MQRCRVATALSLRNGLPCFAVTVKPGMLHKTWSPTLWEVIQASTFNKLPFYCAMSWHPITRPNRRISDEAMREGWMAGKDEPKGVPDGTVFHASCPTPDIGWDLLQMKDGDVARVPC